MSNPKSLKAFAQSLTSAQLPIMTDRTKGDTEDLLGIVVTIRDYGFLTGDNGDYAVFIVDEEPGQFFFGGKVLTEDLKKFDDAGLHEQVNIEGVPMVLTKKKSKNKQTYVNVLFYPESK